jgi:hypothetical protein
MIKGDAAVPVVVTCAFESPRHLYCYRRWLWGSPVTDDGFGVLLDSDDGFIWSDGKNGE